MDSAQLVATIMGAGGGGAVVLLLVKGVLNWLNGSAGRERSRNTSLEAQRVKAIEDRDAANRETDSANVKFFQLRDYASQLRRQLIESGITPDGWPDLDKTVTPDQIKQVRQEARKSNHS